MRYNYAPQGVCPNLITFEIEDGILKDVIFYGGCNGNLSAIATLVKGLSVDEVLEKLSGTRCGGKTTSCSHQLTEALRAALEEEAKR